MHRFMGRQQAVQEPPCTSLCCGANSGPVANLLRSFAEVCGFQLSGLCTISSICIVVPGGAASGHDRLHHEPGMDFMRSILHYGEDRVDEELKM
ncbi:hypothetical protein HPP92_028777 [Vanilla planifolia]|uniref:Uncharacterized protein n=1 Tax=Vanilla planifolia TaxID=51239 RepID=A0A835P6T1_VANPL|nr:hypothetical protein HPP92_028777 [Vanilla planifolia]KAG0446566.1 hypothetical protein HPP92_028766 [Vanilla planifolia]